MQNINENTAFEVIDVTIERIVPNGFGLGFAQGLTIFVSLAAPGDRLRVRIREKKGKIAFAEIVEIIEPSPARVEAPCRYFGTCGGCDFQQLTYHGQLEGKLSIIRDSLKRIGQINFEGDIPIVPSPEPFGYRSRTQWHTDTATKKIGYLKRYSHNIIDVESCPILAAPLQQTLEKLRTELNWQEFWAEDVRIEAATAGNEVSVYSAEIIEPTRAISFEAAGNRYSYDAGSFFQGNQHLIAELIGAALGDFSGGGALDLYCGVGLFSLPLAKKFHQVWAIEADQKAIGFARQNAEHARLTNVEFHVESVTEWLKENMRRNIDFVLLDPPRTGADRGAIEAIIKLGAKQISYVSCDPATLARDLKTLKEFYSINQITALDLFPQTHHVETVVRMSLKS